MGHCMETAEMLIAAGRLGNWRRGEFWTTGDSRDYWVTGDGGDYWATGDSGDHCGEGLRHWRLHRASALNKKYSYH